MSQKRRSSSRVPQPQSAPPRAPSRTARAAFVPRLPEGFALVALCFVFSGAASLTLEVVWNRLLRLVFGSTTLAVSTVLVAYMLGLGLGGLFGGRLAHRLRNPVRTYGWFEISIGLYAVAVPLLLDRLSALTPSLLVGLGFWQVALVRFVAVLGVLMLPTVLMGATLPVLTAALARQHGVLAGRVGLLYGLNTLGAVGGVFLATFVLFPAIGVRATNLSGAALAFLVGVVAVARLARRFGPDAAVAPTSAKARPAKSERPQAPQAGPGRWNAALVTYGVVGFTALAYEVCWTRVLAMILGSSIYAFATMLAAFLLGIALGSLIARRRCDALRRPREAYALAVGLLGVCALGTTLAFGYLPAIFLRLMAQTGTSTSAVVAVNIGTSLLAMIGPTLILGALFPLLLRAVSSDDYDTSRTVGDAYFANTIGAAIGAFAAGFVLIPTLGLQLTMALCIAVDLVCAAALLLSQQERRTWPSRALAASAFAVALGVLALPPAWDAAEITRGVYQLRDESLIGGMLPIVGVPADGLLYYREGINTTVSVELNDGTYGLRVNGKVDATSFLDMPTQVLLGQIPMLFGSRAERVLIIGLGSGVTVGSVALHHPERVDVVELEPAIVEASHYFDEYNHRALEQPNVRVIPEDGRIFLTNTPERYDVIISEPSNPWITGVSNLFTREFFHAAHGALRPGGRLMQWLQLYALQPEGPAAILAALRTEFPYIYAFSYEAGVGDILLLASDMPLAASDFPRLEQQAPEVRDDLVRVGVLTTADFWSLLRLGPEDIEAIAAEAPVVNSDDNMFVELHAPRSLYKLDAVDENRTRMNRFSGAAQAVTDRAGLALNGEQLAELALSYSAVRNEREIAENLLREAQRRGAAANATVAEAHLMEEGESDAVLELLDRAVASNPDTFVPRWHRAQFRAEGEQYEAVLADLDVALRRRPDHARALYLRLQTLVALGRMEEAHAEADRISGSGLNQLEPEVWVLASQAAAGLGQYDDAYRQMLRYLEVYPLDAAKWTMLAEMYEQGGHTDLAAQARTNAEHSRINVIRRQYALAIENERMQQYTSAERLLQNVLTLDPTHEAAQQALWRIGAHRQ